MTVETLKRVLWRIRSNNQGTSVITNIELKRAIMYECGTDARTYRNNRKALVTLGWLKAYSKQKVILTDLDLG